MVRRGLLRLDVCVVLMNALIRSDDHQELLHLLYEASAPITMNPIARDESLEADMIGVVAVCMRTANMLLVGYTIQWQRNERDPTIHK